MDIGAWLIGTVVTGVFLFLWAGLTQAVTPWGIRAVKPLGKESVGDLTSSMQQTTPPSGMYGVFDDRVAAFMAVRPGSYYNMGRYFAIEFATQLIVGAALTGILLLTGALPMGERLLLIALVGVLAEAAIDLQYWNWWGFSTAYALGFAVNRIVGYLVIAFVLVNWVLPAGVA